MKSKTISYLRFSTAEQALEKNKSDILLHFQLTRKPLAQNIFCQATCKTLQQIYQFNFFIVEYKIKPCFRSTLFHVRGNYYSSKIARQSS